MIQKKLKLCAFCQKEKPVFKNATVDGDRLHFCSTGCYNRFNPAAKDKVTIIKKEPYKIPKLSPKQAQRQAKYLKLRLDYLNEHPFCEFSFPGCTGSATDVHHVEGRGIHTDDQSTFKATCRHCHEYGHFYQPNIAKQGGF